MKTMNSKLVKKREIREDYIFKELLYQAYLQIIKNIFRVPLLTQKMYAFRLETKLLILKSQT